MRPVARVIHQSMFHGIGMNVIHMSMEITRIRNRVLPKSLLPDPAPPVTTLPWCDPTFPASTHQIPTHETFLQRPDTRRIIRVSLWQAPEHVQVVGQQDDCFHRPRMILLREVDSGMEKMSGV